MKLSLTTFIKFSITAGLMWFVCNSIDISKTESIILETNLFLFFCAFLIKSFSLSIQAMRWNVIIYQLNIDISLTQAWKNILVGFFFNQALPSSSGGDAIRACEIRHLGIKKVIISIILDRLFGLFALFLSSVICAVILLIGKDINDSMDESLYFIIALNLAGIALISISTFLDKTVKKFGLTWVASKFELKLFSETIRVLIQKKSGIIFLLFSSMFMHFLLGVSGYLILLSLGANPPFLHFFPYFLLALTISTIPISIGGWGVRETAMISLFYYINVNTEITLVFSVLYGLLMICVGLPGGLVWLLKAKTT